MSSSVGGSYKGESSGISDLSIAWTGSIGITSTGASIGNSPSGPNTVPSYYYPSK